jgi:predicted nucleic acid-binding protein
MSGMNAKAFIDTNVLIYAHDIDSAAKHDLAKRVLQQLWTERAGASVHKCSKSSTRMLPVKLRHHYPRNLPEPS